MNNTKIMNALINYVSSESSDSEDYDKSVDLPTSPACVAPLPCQSINFEPPVKSSESNFFNLDSESDEEFQKDTSHVETPSQGNDQIQTTDSTVDTVVKRVPYEDWTLTESIHEDNKKLNEDNNLNENSIFSKQKHFVDRNSFDGTECKRFKVDKMALSSPPNCTACFTVHPRIKPFVHSARSPKSRLPQTLVREFDAHGGAVNRINWCSPQYCHLLLSASMDSTIKIWDVFSTRKTCLRTLSGHEKAVKDAMWSTNGREILSGSYDRTAAVFDVESMTQLFSCQHQEFVTCIKYHPLDSNLFVSGSKNIILGWDSRAPQQPIRRYTYKAKFGQVLDICFIAESTQFITSNDLVSRDSADRNIIVWDFDTGAVLSNQIFQERYTCSRLCHHPTDKTFIAQTHGDYIAQFSSVAPYRMNKCKRYEGHKVSGYDIGCDLSPDGEVIVSGSADGQLMFYSYRLARCIRSIKLDDRNDVVLNTAWHPLLPSLVASATWSGRIGLWQ